uniref:Tyrosine aminotransferase n=1 Tax=Lampea lactea TaxID=1403706 RepID=A0A1S6WNF9_9METZ|nr:tyrosine aminotransferase [Lampea lactea]
MPSICKNKVPISPCAENTINPIRALVDNLVVRPNPDKQLLRLSIGDPSVFGNFNPPPQLFKAVSDNLQTSCYGYGPAHGLEPVRAAIATFYNTDSSPITSEDVYVTSGCSDALRIAIDVLGSDKRNILLPKPGFSLYQTICGNRGIEGRFYDLLPHNDWAIDLEDLESKIDNNTAAILVTNPSNPCGSAFSVKHQLDIIKLADKHNIPIIADEIYKDMVFDGESKSFGELSVNVPVISCGGLAKRWLVPGWRVGWLIVHDKHERLSEVRDGITRLCQVIIGSNMLVQGAIPQILETVPQSFYDDTLARLKKAADIFYSKLSKIPQLRPTMPQGAMYMMVEIKVDQFHDVNDDMEFVEKLISEQSVFPLPANIFGMPNYIRLVLTAPEEIITEACSRISEFCSAHSVSPPNKKSRS